MKHPENFWFAMAMIGGLLMLQAYLMSDLYIEVLMGYFSVIMLNAFAIQYIYGISNRKKR